MSEGEHVRNRIVITALTAAAVVGGIAVPAAQADGGYGDTTITSATVNGGRDIIIGSGTAKTVKVTIYGRDNSGLSKVDIDLNGPNYGYFNSAGACETVTACSRSFTIDPRVDLINSNAGTWYVGAWVDAKDGDFRWTERIRSFRVKRAALLSANASPEPVLKGRAITVTGALKRANWETGTYSAYSGQSVQLQFRKYGATSYTTVKTVTSGSYGALKTTVTASVDGYWRWSYAGNTATGNKVSAGDFVDVR